MDRMLSVKPFKSLMTRQGSTEVRLADEGSETTVRGTRYQGGPALGSRAVWQSGCLAAEETK